MRDPVLALLFLEWQTDTWPWGFLLGNNFPSGSWFLVSMDTWLFSFCKELPSRAGPVSAMFLCLAPTQSWHKQT